MIRLLAVLGMLVALGAMAPARANSPEILQRLMKEPLTLFDWGLYQLERDMARAGERLFANDPTRRARTSAIYDWRQGLVLLSLAAETPVGQRTRPACADLFRRLVAELTGDAPHSPYAAGWYLHDAFQPKAHFFASRFEDVGTKLLKVVRLEVALRASPQDAAAGDSRQALCSGPLNVDPAAMLVELKS